MDRQLVASHRLASLRLASRRLASLKWRSMDSRLQLKHHWRAKKTTLIIRRNHKQMIKKISYKARSKVKGSRTNLWKCSRLKMTWLTNSYR